MTMIAYAFLQYRRLKTARRKKRINGPPPRPTLPAVRLPSSKSSLDHHRSGARIVKNGSAASSGNAQIVAPLLMSQLHRLSRK
jgi:hypothetical protein